MFMSLMMLNSTVAQRSHTPVTENSRFKTVQTDPAIEKQTEDRADYAPDSTSGWQGHGAKGFLQVFPKYLKIALHY